MTIILWSEAVQGRPSISASFYSLQVSHSVRTNLDRLSSTTLRSRTNQSWCREHHGSTR